MSENPHPPLLDAPTLPGQTAGVSPEPLGEQFGDLLLLGEIGRGGMGVVYKAFEPQLRRHVAVKMILSGALSGPGELERFQAEASAAARLTHPNIVKVHRVGVEGERHYFAMDFIDGPSLAQRLLKGPLPGRDAAPLLVTVARAIHHAHKQKVLHRDIKPGNILLDSDGSPHVTDFGLAKQLDSEAKTVTGAVLGTPSYMAPEQAGGSSKSVSFATDVYGLGALLYELITARPPFKGETALDTLLQVMHNEPVPPRLLNPRVERDLETICLKCLSKSPTDRYPTAEELARDLERYCQREQIQARSVNMLDYFSRAIQHSHFDAEFRNYPHVLFWFAAVVGMIHLTKFFMVSGGLPPLVYGSLQGLQFVVLILVLWYYRRGGLLPKTTAERQLWTVWIGYALSSSLMSIIVRQTTPDEASYHTTLVPINCVLTGLSFFVLGATYWGGFYLVGVLFFVVGYLLMYLPTGGGLVFGMLWAGVLLLIGLRLRHLGKERGAEEGR